MNEYYVFNEKKFDHFFDLEQEIMRSGVSGVITLKVVDANNNFIRYDKVEIEHDFAGYVDIYWRND